MRVIEVYGGSGIGGASQHLRLVLPRLAAAGAEITLLSLPPHALEVDVPTVRCVGVRDAAARIRQERGAVVHSHGLKANLSAYLAEPPRLVRTVHSFLADDYPNPWRRRLVEAFDALARPRVKAFITPSEALRQDLLRRGVALQRVSVVPHGIPEPEPPYGRPDLLSACGFDPVARLVLVAARLEPVKGVDLAIGALSHLGPEWALVVFGEGSRRQELEAQVAACGLSERVRLLGFRPDARRFFAAADVVLIPSRQESIGLVAIEAMALGSRLVATAVGGMPETVGPAGLLATPGDPAALAAAIVQAHARKDLPSIARRRFEDHFSIDLCVQKTMSILRNISEQGGLS